MRIAAVTMAYDEPDFLPIWLRHYAAQVGRENCHVIDHGSDDGSTDGLGSANVLRLPRSPHDDPKRAKFLSEYCAALLRWYDWVICGDIDELLVADPRYHGSLRELCAAAPQPVMTAVGLNVQHLVGEEKPIDPANLISPQRRWAKLVSSMCKPLLISRPVAWTPGLHTCDAPVAFAPLFLFHLRHYDYDQGRRRLAKTRTMPWQYDYAGSHQKISDREWLARLRRAASRPRLADVSLDLAEPPLAEMIERLTAQQHTRAQELYKIDIDMNVPALWRIPDRFIGTF